MANRTKQRNSVIRAQIARKLAKRIARQNPSWSLQQVNDAAYKQADLQIKRGEAQVS